MLFLFLFSSLFHRLEDKQPIECSVFCIQDIRIQKKRYEIALVSIVFAVYSYTEYIATHIKYLILNLPHPPFPTGLSSKPHFAYITSDE